MDRCLGASSIKSTSDSSPVNPKTVAPLLPQPMQMSFVAGLAFTIIGTEITITIGRKMRSIKSGGARHAAHQTP